MKKRLRNAALSLLLLIGSLVSLLFVLEMGTRWLIGIPLPEKMPLMRVRADRELGWRMLPNDVHYTYQQRVELNELGFRGPPVGTKTQGEYRILFIGDSHIYGQGISDDVLLTTLVEHGLARMHPACTVRVINLGARAYSINQELALLRAVGIGLQPDRVILFPYINDFEDVDVLRRFERFRDLDWYMFDISGRPEGETLRKWQLHQLLRKSAFLMWAHDVVSAWQERGNIEELLLTGRTSDAVSDHIARTLEHLEGFAVLAQRHGFLLDLAPIPVAAELVSTFENSLYRPTFRQFAIQAGLGFVDLLPALQVYQRQNARVPVIPFDGHYDAQGQRAMAGALLEYLSPALAGCAG